jgi:DNA-directed RNA polymerase subunit M/transcription elongation factor TFIIS
MGVIETSKIIADLVKRGVTIDLHEKIMQLREEALELQEENLTLKTENLDLKKKTELSEKLTYKRKVYYLDGDEVPYCPYCYDRKKLLIHLSSYDENNPKEQICDCNDCGIQYRVVGDSDFIFWGRVK